MNPTLARLARTVAVILPFVCTCQLLADGSVCVISWADKDYLERRAAENPPKVEKYVVMQGRRFDGVTRDRPFEKQSFIGIARSLAAQLVRAKYEPAPNVESADLLLLIHWGTTRPRVSFDTLRGTVTYGPEREDPHSPGEVFENHPADDMASLFFADDTERYRAFAFELAERVTHSLSDEVTNSSNANLLGYTAQLRRIGGGPVMSATEQSMRSDLDTERYFIIVKAYDLKAPPVPGRPPKPVWTLHMNTRSPGQSFPTAVANMSRATINFAGTANPDLTVVRPDIPKGEVEIGELQVIGVVQ